jgi:hypothetical protein
MVQTATRFPIVVDHGVPEFLGFVRIYRTRSGGRGATARSARTSETLRERREEAEREHK